jgi:hypothetical protein
MIQFSSQLTNAADRNSLTAPNVPARETPSLDSALPPPAAALPLGCLASRGGTAIFGHFGPTPPAESGAQAAGLCGRRRCLAAHKKARDKGRGQCVSVLITQGSLRVIEADGALIERRRQSGDNSAHGPPRAGAFEPRNLLQRHSLDSKELIWETDMTLFSPTVLYPPIAMHDRRIFSDIVFGVWASTVLIGLAIVSVALGVAPIVDPTIFPAP